MAMEECKNLVAGNCTVASSFANYQVAAMTHESSCQECLKTSNPMAKNKVTCGLAVLALSKAKLLNTEQHSDLLRCGLSLPKKPESLENLPGSALTKIFKDIGIFSGNECQCASYANAMDSWGWSGCTWRRQEIIDHLNLQKPTWLDMIRVMAAGYFTTGSIVDRALLLSKPTDV